MYRLSMYRLSPLMMQDSATGDPAAAVGLAAGAEGVASPGKRLAGQTDHWLSKLPGRERGSPETGAWASLRNGAYAHVSGR